MEQETLRLPFGLRLVDLPKVEIACEYHDPKPGTGSKRLSFSVKGVKIVSQAGKEQPAEEISGKGYLEAIPSLLIRFEEEGFFEMDEDQVGDTEGPVRMLRLTLPGRSRTVKLTGIELAGIERLIGAVKLAAGFSVPEAQGKEFLKDL
jgi:hypothetical protein